MKKYIVLSLLVGLVLSSCSFTLTYEQGSGNVIQETRAIDRVDRIAFEGIGKLVITQGSETSLEIEAEDNILPRIVTEVDRGMLTIRFDTERWENIIRPTKPIIFRLQVENLQELSLSGLGDVELMDLELDVLAVRLSGAGTIDASGSARRLEINVSGAGTYDSADLESEDVNINLSGAGNAVVWATEALDVSISGLGNVSYYGSPVVHQSVTGLGNIQSMGER